MDINDNLFAIKGDGIGICTKTGVDEMATNFIEVPKNTERIFLDCVVRKFQTVAVNGEYLSIALEIIRVLGYNLYDDEVKIYEAVNKITNNKLLVIELTVSERKLYILISELIIDGYKVTTI